MDSQSMEARVGELLKVKHDIKARYPPPPNAHALIFDHVAGTLLNCMNGDSYFQSRASTEEGRAQHYKNFKEREGSLLAYFNLLEEHPDFREGELSGGNGMFPEASPRISDPIVYVQYANIKLRELEDGNNSQPPPLKIKQP